MKVLFLSLSDYDTLNFPGLYSDLLRQFVQNGHEVYVVSPMEKRRGRQTHIIQEPHTILLKLRIGNITKTNIIEKGFSTVLIERQVIAGIKQYFSNVSFDLVLYTTPPITFCSAIEFIKKRDKCVTYLLLKDIFPQNSVDIGLLSKNGMMGVIYRYFRRKEKRLYSISDHIGCMSPANVEYILRNNPEVDRQRVEVCPNTVDAVDLSVCGKEKNAIRNELRIPLDKKVFIYGGNLGKPQGVDFLLECLRAQKDNKKVFFLIMGSGTEYEKIQQFLKENECGNVKLQMKVEREKYNQIVGACDVGMIFLDRRFTIPNFPSRILSYMQAKLPVISVTDSNTDVGDVIENGGFGWKCSAGNLQQFNETIDRIADRDLTVYKEKAFTYLKEHFSSEIAYSIIMSHFR